MLVADDEPALLVVLEHQLTREGFAVRTADSVDSALAELGGAGAGAVVCDMNLPGGCRALLEAVRRWYPSTGFVLISGDPAVLELGVELHVPAVVKAERGSSGRLARVLRRLVAERRD